MAENYSVKQVVEIIKNGSVTERVDVARRYPLLSQVALSIPDFAVDMLNSIKYCNARKIDRYYQDFLNGDADDQDNEEVEDTEEVAEKPKKKGRPSKKAKEDDTDDEDVEDDDEEEEAPKKSKKGRSAKKSKKNSDDDENELDEDDEESEDDADRKSTRLNSSHVSISYAVFCLKKKTNKK